MNLWAPRLVPSDVTWVHHHSILAGLANQPARLLRREMFHQDKKTRRNVGAAVAAFSWCAPEKEKRRLLQRDMTLPEDRRSLREPWRIGSRLSRSVIKAGNAATLCFPQRRLWAVISSASSETADPATPSARSLCFLSFLSGFRSHFPKPHKITPGTICSTCTDWPFRVWVFSCSEMPNISPWSDRKDFSLDHRKWWSKSNLSFSDRNLLVPADSQCDLILVSLQHV